MIQGVGYHRAAGERYEPVALREAIPQPLGFSRTLSDEGHKTNEAAEAASNGWRDEVPDQ